MSKPTFETTYRTYSFWPLVDFGLWIAKHVMALKAARTEGTQNARLNLQN